MPRFSVFKVKGRGNKHPRLCGCGWTQLAFAKTLRIDSAAAFAPAPPPALQVMDKNGVYYKELMEVLIQVRTLHL